MKRSTRPGDQFKERLALLDGQLTDLQTEPLFREVSRLHHLAKNSRSAVFRKRFTSNAVLLPMTTEAIPTEE